VNPNWNETDTSKPEYIQNKPAFLSRWWEDPNSTDSIYYQPTAGRVGIGKSPASGYKLDVDGNARATTFTSTTEDVSPFQVSSLVRVDNLNASLLDGLGKGAFLRTDEDTSTLYNVGIGTVPSASYKLDVKGQVRATIFTSTTESVSPFQVSSLVRVDNLNASLLDGHDAGKFMRTDGNTSTSGTLTGTRLISTVATGTAPLTVTSTTKVTNLNADLLDGYDASHFLNYANLTGVPAATPSFNGGTITSALTINYDNPTIIFKDTDNNSAFLHCNSSTLYVLRGQTNAGGWTQVNGQNPWEFNLTNNDSKCGGSLNVIGSVTAARVIPYSTMNNANYWAAAIEVRELNQSGLQGGAWSVAPRIGFHWGGVIASQILVETSGRIAIVNNPGTAYEAFACGKALTTGRVDIHQSGGVGGGQNRFTGIEDTTYRSQLVLSSAYSDLVIASSQGNDNHGSTLTFASYNPNDANDYRKFVINQGNWGARMHFLDFGYANAGARANPHQNINATDTVLTLNGINKRVGIRNTSPVVELDVNGSIHVNPSPSGASSRLFIANNCGLAVGSSGYTANFNQYITFGGIQYMDANGGPTILFSITGNTKAVGDMIIDGVTSVKTNVWHTATDGRMRVYYAANSRTYYYSPNGYNWRKSSEAVRMELLDDGYFQVSHDNGTFVYFNGTTTRDLTYFTGQHRSLTNNTNLFKRTSNFKGLIVVSTGNYISEDDNGITLGKSAITIDDAMPIVELAHQARQKSVYGVVSRIEEGEEREFVGSGMRMKAAKGLGEHRLVINSLGEGAIWVCDAHGPLENGDLICSSSVAGYGMRQDDDIMRNYTVAKITMACDFNPRLVPKQKLKTKELVVDEVTSTVNDLDDNGMIQVVSDEGEEYEYEVRYLMSDGTQITHEEHCTLQGRGETVYKAAFVGCTYHCG
jgi:hypothetical protein